MKQQRVLILGCNGQVGQALVQSAPSQYDVVAFQRNDVDFARTADLKAKISNVNASVIINAAAYTAVDKAETEFDLARQINTTAVKAIAEVAARQSAFMVHYSTDYVFNGRASTPYLPEDQTDPLSIYGQTKRAGEESVLNTLSLENYLVLRTQWVHSPGGRNFVSTISRALQNNTSLRIVSDQVGTPTLAADIAEATWRALEARVSGLHHMTNTGAAAWFDFAHAIKALLKIQKPDAQLAELTPIATADYPLPAKRPAYALLDKSSLIAATGKTPRHWQDALIAAWREPLS
jgi:dTDP-4-dehydrorhamnose reductase